MIQDFLRKVFGSKNDRDLKRIQPLVQQIGSLESSVQALSDDDIDRVTVGIEMIDKGIPRTGYPVKEGGEVSSGTMSPSLNKAIGMAIINKSHAKLGDEIHVEIRGKNCRARVVEVPFLSK